MDKGIAANSCISANIQKQVSQLPLTSNCICGSLKFFLARGMAADTPLKHFGSSSASSELQACRQHSLVAE